MSLLSKARNHRVGGTARRFTQEEVELCEAWLTDEVSLTAVSKALNTSPGAAYAFLALCSRQIFQEMADK